MNFGLGWYIKQQCLDMKAFGVLDYIENREEEIEKLEKENAELKERLQIESQSLHEQCEIVSRQVEQIEKMENVGNCKKSMTCAKWNEKQTMLGCMKFCKNCKEWELAE